MILGQRPPPGSRPRMELMHDLAVAIRTVEGRSVVDRSGAADMAEVKLPTIDYLYRNRARNGFPERIPGTTEWYADEVRSWAANHDSAKKARLTTVDRTGDPHELVDAPTAARILGYQDRRSLSNSSVWPLLLARVDDQEELPSGRVRRRWTRRTVEAIADQRTGGSGGGRPTGPRGGPVDRTGDPDDELDPAATARVLGYSRADAIPAEVLDIADHVTTGPRGRQRRTWTRRTLWNYADAQLPN